MRKIVLYMFMTLDGLVAGPNDEFDDFEPSQEEHQFANELFDLMDGAILGRITYEGFSEYWDTLDLTDKTKPQAEIEFAQIFRRLKRIVVSHTLETNDANTIVIKENLAENLQKIKQEVGKNLILVCGPELLGALMDEGLVDEYMLMIKPRVLGKGKALFRDLNVKANLRLVSTRVFSSGTVLHHYEQESR